MKESLQRVGLDPVFELILAADFEKLVSKATKCCCPAISMRRASYFAMTGQSAAGVRQLRLPGVADPGKIRVSDACPGVNLDVTISG